MRDSINLRRVVAVIIKEETASSTIAASLDEAVERCFFRGLLEGAHGGKKGRKRKVFVTSCQT